MVSMYKERFGEYTVGVRHCARQWKDQAALDLNSRSRWGNRLSDWFQK